MGKCLIIVRSGKDSLHETWLKGWTPDLGWDLVCANFGGASHRGTLGQTIDTSAYLTKQVFVNHLLDSGGNDIGVDLDQYDYLWFPDDDILMDTASVSTFFQWCARTGADLSQPSLGEGSYITHPVTCKHQNSDFRNTTFIEVMAPCFSRTAWRILVAADRFRTLSGWGVELFWTHLLNPLIHPFFVFDAVSVVHTRQVGGPFYPWMPQGLSADQEARTELDRHCIEKSLGWFRCSISLSFANNLLRYDSPGFIDNILNGIGYAYRRPGDKLRGIAYLQSNSVPDTPINHIPVRIFGHATFADYLMAQVNVSEWVQYFSERRCKL